MAGSSVTERPDKVWLFDMRNDPTEQHNVASAHPDRVNAMRAMLAAHNEAQVEPAWPALIEAPISIDKTLSDPDSPEDEYVYWPN